MTTEGNRGYLDSSHGEARMVTDSFQFVAYEFSGIFGENNNPWTSVMFCVKFVIPCDDNELLLIFNIFP